ncbi:MAG TPA: DUF4365 domain-containing protein [Candidatus Acidoferrales bacterium]
MTARPNRKRPRPKTISAQGITGQKGINVIERVVLDMGSQWTPSGPNEVGIDGYIELFDPTSHKPLGITVAAQSKVVTSLVGNTDNLFDFWCDPSDVEYWLNGNTPVILVVSAGKVDQAYWISVKSYFKDWKPGASTTVAFDKAKNRFSEASFFDLVNIAAPKLGLYVAPLRRNEVLYTNLLHLQACPATIFVAQTDCRNQHEVWSALKTAPGESDAGWIFWEKKIFSFHNLAAAPWSSICELGTLEEFGAVEWSESKELQQKNIFVQLLNRTLRTQIPDVRFWPQEDCYALMGKPRKISYQSIKRPSKLTVISQFSSTSATTGRKFVWLRHLAFQGQFRSFSGEWYLEITPTYRFTSDGYTLERFHEDRLSGIKRLEGNRAVLSSVLFWADYLRPRAGLFKSDPLPLKFGDLLSFDATIGIDDRIWRSEDASLPAEASLFGGENTGEGEAIDL